MRPDLPGVTHEARRLLRLGRFADALSSIDASSPIHADPSRSALVADLLQRTGDNQRSHQIAKEILKHNPKTGDAASRSLFVIGNVLRDRGELTAAISSFQAALKSVGEDAELACWIQLRILAAISDLAGPETAATRVGEVKRRLTKLGDPRPFCALHLWHAEADTTRGRLDSAHRHLQIAQTLLVNIEDAWLSGYLATNSFGVSYYSAEIKEARHWAETAIHYAKLSGHAAARRAAFANFGQIEFALGRTSVAEDYYRQALECSEPGTPPYMAILDSIAQTKLHQGELAECRRILDELDESSLSRSDSQTVKIYTVYRSWALQTHVQLLLKQGQFEQAQQLCSVLETGRFETSQPRLRAVLGLVSAESYALNKQFVKAAGRLDWALSNSVNSSPDLLAETERVIGEILSLNGTMHSARVHYQRALDIFGRIGHVLGRSQIETEAATVLRTTGSQADAYSVTLTLDRVRALIETNRRPELFGIEAVKLLQELQCSSHFEIGAGSSTFEMDSPSDLPTITVPIGAQPDGPVLCIRPDRNCDSILAALIYKRVIEGLAQRETAESSDESDLLWPSAEALSGNDVVFASDPMVGILKTVNKVAPTNVSVLITGETGSGKEVLARAIHDRSDRSGGPFVAFNCAAVPRELLESQLFGYRKGAFSGANEAFAGIIRGASGGTVVLDEIGDLPIDMQPKLLRFLESGEIHPLGETRPVSVDVRLLFATNARLDQLVAERRFREDLFFRINVIHISIPPLRERRDEIPTLVNRFAAKWARELSKTPPKFTSDALEHMVFYSWPGNVRQLTNEVRRIVVMSDGLPEVTVHDLAPEIRNTTVEKSNSARTDSSFAISLNQALSRAIHDLERAMIQNALKSTHGRVEPAAKLLGLSRKGLYLKRQRLGLL